MRNHLFILLFSSVVLALYTSCSAGDDVMDVVGETSNTPIIFSASAMGGELSAPLVTTRGHSTDETYNGGYTFKANDVVAVALTGAGVTARPTSEEIKLYKVAGGSGQNNMTYWQDASGSTTRGFDWYSTTETLAKLRGWSYAGNNENTPAVDPIGQSFSIATASNVSDQSGTETKELLYKEQTSVGYATSVNIPLEHQLSRVVIKVTESADGTNPTSPATLTINSVKIGNGSTGNTIPLTATFKPSVANYHWDTYGSELGVITPKHEASGHYSAVMFPMNYAAGTKFICVNVTDAESNTLDYIYSIPTGGFEMHSGKQYNFDITILRKEITATCTISDWGDADGDGVTDNADVTKTPTAAMDHISGNVGQVICSDGTVYNTVTQATAAGKTAIAMIAYVGQYTGDSGTEEYSVLYNHGLAMALTNVSGTSGAPGDAGMYWNDAVTACQNYTVSAPDRSSGWFLPSHFQMKRIFDACGGDTFSSSESTYNAPLNIGNLVTRFADCGASFLYSMAYWTSSEISAGTGDVWRYYTGADYGGPSWTYHGKTAYQLYACPVFAF